MSEHLKTGLEVKELLEKGHVFMSVFGKQPMRVYTEKLLAISEFLKFSHTHNLLEVWGRDEDLKHFPSLCKVGTITLEEATLLKIIDFSIPKESLTNIRSFLANQRKNDDK